MIHINQLLLLLLVPHHPNILCDMCMNELCIYISFAGIQVLPPSKNKCRHLFLNGGSNLSLNCPLAVKWSHAWIRSLLKQSLDQSCSYNLLIFSRTTTYYVNMISTVVINCDVDYSIPVGLCCVVFHYANGNQHFSLQHVNSGLVLSRYVS
jgi:hypothetical protein